MKMLLRPLVLALLAAAPLAHADSPRDPIIAEARADAASTTLVVVGTAFPASPRLLLGTLAAPLIVTFASSTRIDALLPGGLAPGSYLLSVTNMDGNGRSSDGDGAHGDEFWVTLGSQGARGPQGVAGPAGPAGPTGQQGIAGPVGPTGATGPQGPMGVTGATGPAGADGTGGALPSLEALVGLPCENFHFRCRDSRVSLVRDVATNVVSLICRPATDDRLLAIEAYADKLHGETLRITTPDGGFIQLTEANIRPSSDNPDGFTQPQYCNGAVVTITATRTGANPGGAAMFLGPECSAPTLPPESTATCTITMTANRSFIFR